MLNAPVNSYSDVGTVRPSNHYFFRGQQAVNQYFLYIHVINDLLQQKLCL